MEGLLEFARALPWELQITSFFLLGLLGVGLPTMRTLNVLRGKYWAVIPLSLAGSANMFIFTYFIIEKNWSFVIWNSIGAAVSVSYLAYREHLRREKRHVKTQ